MTSEGFSSRPLTTSCSKNPYEIVALVGQYIEFELPADEMGGRVFAVFPPLPKGLTLDQLTGRIHGVPNQATHKAEQFFVATCVLGGSAAVTAVMSMHVLDASAPGHKMSNQPRCGLSGCDVPFLGTLDSAAVDGY